MNSETTRVGACILAADMDKMARFYRDVLGLSTQWRDGESFAEFRTKSGYLSFWLYDRKMFAEDMAIPYEPPKGVNQTFEIGLWLESFAAVDEEYERLSKLNVSFPCGAPKTFPFGIRNFYVTDPEGNLLEIGSWKQGGQDEN